MNRPRSRVRAIFRDVVVQFEAAADTTFEKLCSVVGTLATGYGTPILVEVTRIPFRSGNSASPVRPGAVGTFGP